MSLSVQVRPHAEAIAAPLAWQARLDAIAKGATGKSVGRGRVTLLAD